MARVPAGLADLASEASYEAIRQAPATRRKTPDAQAQNKKRPVGRFFMESTEASLLAAAVQLVDVRTFAYR
ncbi:MAG: hypothetical protein NWS28_13315, partial [Limnohabitans sp.]|nr:hypothetical protein [Limnohabitans sp.]